LRMRLRQAWRRHPMQHLMAKVPLFLEAKAKPASTSPSFWPGRRHDRAYDQK
jgi:hypothetical protein